ncbi:hypothetical protein CJ184_006060 [Actinotignum urinale]|uniref:Uncharacterized protein n=1 Tax=Actinotignum urinale TaxID=190146 RepID=A0AAW9HNS4_9ACTO|nr:hypothetical protein [Actinotignum urinale]MDY5155311.1 hypothetical protein [Actinotignum urinale]WIK58809.1 hypothetical protein CJ184_006060 [Actinotignum urinale]
MAGYRKVPAIFMPTDASIELAANKPAIIRAHHGCFINNEGVQFFNCFAKTSRIKSTGANPFQIPPAGRKKAGG